MQGPFSLHEARVLYDGRELLQRSELTSAITNSMRRKLRLVGFDKTFWRELAREGESSLTWNFTRHNAKSDRAWVAFHAWAAPSALYHLYCVGPKAAYAIERINTVLCDKTPKWLRKQLAGKTKQRKRRRKKTKHRQVASPQVRKPKKGPKILASHRLVAQYQHSVISFAEAIELCVLACQVKRESRRTAREIVASELYRSLDHSEDLFAQFCRGTFRLHFRFTREPEVRDRALPPVRVWCDKDGSKEYRRTRKWLRGKLLGLSSVERFGRRPRLDLRSAA